LYRIFTAHYIYLLKRLNRTTTTKLDPTKWDQLHRLNYAIVFYRKPNTTFYFKKNTFYLTPSWRLHNPGN